MFLIVTKRNIHIPGDERSRECPGHGYPASTETVDVITKFYNRHALDAWLERYASREPFELFEATAMKATPSTSWDISESKSS